MNATQLEYPKEMTIRLINDRIKLLEERLEALKKKADVDSDLNAGWELSVDWVEGKLTNLYPLLTICENATVIRLSREDAEAVFSPIL